MVKPAELGVFGEAPICSYTYAKRVFCDVNIDLAPWAHELMVHGPKFITHVENAILTHRFPDEISRGMPWQFLSFCTFWFSMCAGPQVGLYYISFQISNDFRVSP